MNVVCIVQARNGNTRLPDKGDIELGGKSVLQNVVERIQRASKINDLCVAFPRSDSIGETCREIGVPWYEAGYGIDDSDLIGRYLAAANSFKADLVVRVCADNPCVEPEAINWLIENTAGMSDPCRILKLNSENFAGDHDGFGGELYTFEMLEWMDRTIKDPIYREHPHKFWRDMGAWAYVGKDYPRGFRLDVNTEADYQKLKRIYDHFGHNRFTVKEVMDYLGKASMAERNLST